MRERCNSLRYQVAGINMLKTSNTSVLPWRQIIVMWSSNLEEVSLKNSWNNRGISMEYAWNKYGWSMDAVWKFVWIMYGICMDWAWMRVWNMYGISMEYPGRYFLLEIFFEIFIFSIFFWNFENLKSRFWKKKSENKLKNEQFEKYF